MNDDALQLTVERVHTLDGNGALKAFADVNVNKALLVRGFRVVDGKNGIFVGMPQQASKQGKWFDAVKPLTKEMHAQLTRTVLDAYEAETTEKR